MKRIICIGGGSLKEKSTLKIDEYIANLAKQRAGEKRAYGLFIGTASHDCMPAFNSFRKTYTSNFDIKADCLLLVNVDTPIEKINDKFSKADLIYVGGGDTIYMLEKWKEKGITDKIIDAYNRGVIICGLSAGAICWFKNMYTDSVLATGKEGEYSYFNGLGILDGTCCPHYNLRKEDFNASVKNCDIKPIFALEDDSAIAFTDGVFERAITSGGNAFKLEVEKDSISHFSL